MRIRRVALFCAMQLLCESLQHTLGSDPEIEVLGPWAINDQAVGLITSPFPDVVLIAEPLEKVSSASWLTGQILESFPNLPVIRVTLEDNLMRFYSAQTIPASSNDLIGLIHTVSLTDQQDLR